MPFSRFSVIATELSCAVEQQQDHKVVEGNGSFPVQLYFKKTIEYSLSIPGQENWGWGEGKPVVNGELRVGSGEERDNVKLEREAEAE